MTLTVTFNVCDGFHVNSMKPAIKFFMYLLLTSVEGKVRTCVDVLSKLHRKQ